VTDVDEIFEAPDLIVLNPDDAPAPVVDVQVIRSAAGAPVAVRATVLNRRREPLISSRLEVIVFSSAGIIRARLFKPDSRGISGLSSRAAEVLITAAVTREGRRRVSERHHADRKMGKPADARASRSSPASNAS
jgi:hypothetical protein